MFALGDQSHAPPFYLLLATGSFFGHQTFCILLDYFNHVFGGSSQISVFGIYRRPICGCSEISVYRIEDDVSLPKGVHVLLQNRTHSIVCDMDDVSLSKGVHILLQNVMSVT